MNQLAPNAAASAARYSILQVRLHWLVVILVALQFLLQSAMVDTMAALRAGDTPGAAAYLMANLHLLSGLGIGFLMAFRLYLRFSGPGGLNGPDSVPAYEPNQAPTRGVSIWLARAAIAVHLLFYLLLLTMPLSGLSAWYEVAGAVTIHYWQKMALLLLLSVHVAAALLHLFVLRDDVFKRILRFR